MAGFAANSAGQTLWRRRHVRIVQEENADMLIVGAHGHSGLKDFIYGETINAVRHELKIPVLIVHL